MEFFNDAGDDPLKPTLFELVAQEQLRDLLQPALKYVLSVFAQRYPRYLIRVVNRHEEFYALLMLIVERHYLRKHGASFSENFYGLKRRRRPLFETERAKAAVPGVLPEERLRDREILRSLIFLVGLPFLRTKAQEYYEDLGGGIQSEVIEESLASRTARALSEESFAGRLRRMYKAVFPLLNATFEVWLLVHNIAYLFDQTPHYRPWLAWIGVDLRRVGIDDLRAAQQAMKPKLDPARTQGVFRSLRRLLLSSPRLLLDSLNVILPTAIFFVKFLEWWYSPSSPARALSSSPLGPAVPPPSLARPHPQGLAVDEKAYGQCALCSRGLANATALPSGYVFCYRCAYSYVERHGRCPVTLLPARVWELPAGHEGTPALRVVSDHRPLIPSPRTQFGKQIQVEQVPGWSAYYLDYKSLKKIISSLEANRPPSEAEGMARSVRPGDLFGRTTVPATVELSVSTPGVAEEPFILASLGQDDDRGPYFQAHKAAFFFKLERELEKINAFYLEKEAELKLRLETLLSKRRAAAMRVLPDSPDDITNNVEWSAVEEGFRLLERDLGKLQQFVEINATGFRKILKKWDKRSKSTTKELYLARQVEVQPVFNRQLISEMSDTVAACLLDLTDLSTGLSYEGSLADEKILSRELGIERTDRNVPLGPFLDLESSLRKAVADHDRDALRELVRYSDSLSQARGAHMHVTRVLWKAVIDAPLDLADLILASTSGPFDFMFVDDINGRTSLHEVAIVGVLRLVNICLEKGVQANKTDVYGRSALHYAAMYGHDVICKRLIEVGLPPDITDVDNCTPLVYATLRGFVGCVRVLLEDGKVSVRSSTPTADLIPLSLAARAGHIDVVKLLLGHGAPSVPNTNGEYPIHLAAQEGHAEIVQLLASHEGWDIPDKYNEWTPLFHAARYGRDACLRGLLDVGSRVDRFDESGNSALYYAAWYGHRPCVALLLETAANTTPGPTPITQKSPLTDTQRSTGTEFDIDIIPSLYLPPPMMPYRVYGHNYLDKTSLIQVTIGHLTSRFGTEAPQTVSLRRPLAGSQYDERHLHSSPMLKLVMTATPAITSAPYSVPLPVRDQKIAFNFQVSSASTLSLEFSLYPNFGTRTIGRAVALPYFFQGIQNGHPFVLPILDPRLHVIGEVAFEVNIITPFRGVTLEIGGAVETYWKSLATPVHTPSSKVVSSKSQQSRRSMTSVHTSPSNLSTTVASGHSLTHSSVTGSYVYVTVQVTRDFHPVAFAQWPVSEEGYHLGVADLTLQEFEALAQRSGKCMMQMDNPALSPLQWSQLISGCMISLAELLRVVPAVIGICLELAYPPQRVRERLALRHQLDLNDVTDSLLRTVYDTTTAPEGTAGRRPVVFTSFSPDACAALNWKQPNYPVFLATQCGEQSRGLPSATALGVDDVRDYRFTSLDSAVDFAKANNLLGVLLDAGLLVRVPSLIQGVKDLGLLVGTFGTQEELAQLPTSSGADANGVDAALQDGVLTYFNSYKRIQ
ncbi:cyclin-dependent protein kinase inhibitor [Rhodofomes roseus]|uniref:Peroxisome assembly protein 12 n=1 Tax=Rhodofomes roseus TaxID=34475 RepID=A0ABQ8KXC0_9APHY|nr:cyclin-dependent protein kinase inhibitor [Rhodofomes roseus]KAH9843881.1 cyclin-dependent protein kinase inhibitor [Rhodofomes roseus]